MIVLLQLFKRRAPRYQDRLAHFQKWDAAARAAGASLIRRGKKNPKGKTFLFINNRLEGNALNTIRAMLDLAETDGEELAGVDTPPA